MSFQGAFLGNLMDVTDDSLLGSVDFPQQLEFNLSNFGSNPFDLPQSHFQTLEANQFDEHHLNSQQASPLSAFAQLLSFERFLPPQHQSVFVKLEQEAATTEGPSSFQDTDIDVGDIPELHHILDNSPTAMDSFFNLPSDPAYMTQGFSPIPFYDYQQSLHVGSQLLQHQPRELRVSLKIEESRPQTPESTVTASRPASPVVVEATRRYVSGTSATRKIRIHDGKRVYEAEMDVLTPLATVRQVILEHRPRDTHHTIVILMDRVSPKRLSDTGAYDAELVLPNTRDAVLSNLPSLQTVFLYDLCQGQPLRGENTKHLRLCHPKSNMCEAHRKQMERAKVKRPSKEDRLASPEPIQPSNASEEAKRRCMECPKSFEVLLGDVCPLGQELLALLGSYSPMRLQIRQMLSEVFQPQGPLALLSLRWPRCWNGFMPLGFDSNAVVVDFAKSISSRLVHLRSSAMVSAADCGHKVSLEGHWSFAHNLSIALIVVESAPGTKIRLVGSVRGELSNLTEFWSQGTLTPVLFAPAMLGQRDAFASVLVVVEDVHHSRIIHQQIIKFSDPDTWSKPVALQWMQLVERKFSTDGTLEPHTSWTLPLRQAFAPSSDIVVRNLFGLPDSTLVRFGFSMRDVVRLSEEARLQAKYDSMTERNEFCVRKPITRLLK